MGCWNKTCGLSKLHIYTGDPVYVFVIEQNLNHDRCYSTAFWSPVLVPFESVYNDYGGGEDSSGVWLPYIMEGIRSELIEREVGENECHDIAVKREGFGEEQFFEAVHEGRLLTKDWQGKPREVDFVMFRKDVADDILTNLEVDKYVGEGKGNRPDDTSGNHYVYYRFADVLADMPAFLDKLELVLKERMDLVEVNQTIADKMTEEQILDYKATLVQYMLYRDLGSIYDYRDTNKAAWYLYRDGSRFSSLVGISDIIIQAVVSGNRTLAEQLLTEHLRASFLNMVVDSVRGLWMPGGHEGSQASEHTGYRALTAAINRALDEEHKRWDE